MEILALADDMTGALEVGGKFAGRGIESVVTTIITTIASRAGATVVVIDTETRHLNSSEAAEVIQSLPRFSPRLLIKKTDSTLRGNIAAELVALAEAYPGWGIAFVPAYPALGRTVRDGRLYVDGVPVHRTSFAHDRLNPVTDSRVASVLGNSIDCEVFDAETDSDINRIADHIFMNSRYRIVAGAAAITEAIAARFDLVRVPPSEMPPVPRCLIVNGSTHEASLRQVEFARDQGCAGRSWRIFERTVPVGATPLEIARDTGRQVCEVLARDEYDGLLVFGGDTAFWIVKELGSRWLKPLGEIVAGVPISALSESNLYLITKAGGFGEAGVICRIKEILNGCR